jgi:hypothetical protein
VKSLFGFLPKLSDKRCGSSPQFRMMFISPCAGGFLECGNLASSHKFFCCGLCQKPASASFSDDLIDLCDKLPRNDDVGSLNIHGLFSHYMIP